MQLLICRQCRQAVAPYYISQGLCDSCKWDTWIPIGYEKKERYRFEPTWGHRNRTCRPPLGVPFLDVGMRQVNLSLIHSITSDKRKILAMKLLGQGYTEKQVGEQLGVCQGMVSRWKKKIKKN